MRSRCSPASRRTSQVDAGSLCWGRGQRGRGGAASFRRRGRVRDRRQARVAATAVRAAAPAPLTAAVSNRACPASRHRAAIRSASGGGSPPGMLSASFTTVSHGARQLYFSPLLVPSMVGLSKANQIAVMASAAATAASTVGAALDRIMERSVAGRGGQLARPGAASPSSAIRNQSSAPSRKAWKWCGFTRSSAGYGFR